MKVLYLDCGMGAAGDMLTAALLELLPAPDSFIKELNALGIPGVRYAKETAVKCGITGTHISVTVNGEEEDCGHHHHHHHDHEHEHEHHHHDHDHEHHHDHEHSHGHGHHHHHSGLHDIEHIVCGHLPLRKKVKADVMAVYDLIAQAESHAHGMPVEEIHFHEVGTMDAVADVTAVCMLIDRLHVDKIIVSPIHVGCGEVHCAHGVLPVPAPATAHILQGVPMYGGEIQGELCTPTGAALLKHFATEFGPMPPMRTTAIGYGMGKKDFSKANCVRALLGEIEETRNDDALELACNLDDMSAEDIAFAMDTLLSAGALDVWTTPIGMKKCRCATMLSILCKPSDKDTMVQLIFTHTSTIGIRETVHKRYTLTRESVAVETPYGTMHKKVSTGYGVTKEKYEHDELARIAKEQGKSIQELKNTIAKEQ